MTLHNIQACFIREMWFVDCSYIVASFPGLQSPNAVIEGLGTRLHTLKLCDKYSRSRRAWERGQNRKSRPAEHEMKWTERIGSRQATTFPERRLCLSSLASDSTMGRTRYMASQFREVKPTPSNLIQRHCLSLPVAFSFLTADRLQCRHKN